MKKSRRHQLKPIKGTDQQFAVPGDQAADCIAWMDRMGWNSDPKDDRGELLRIDYEMFMYNGLGANRLIVKLWDRRKRVLFKLTWGGQ